ncbi:DUF4838 domain-containing protein [Hungatella sp.]|uniref:DUF4838 domain-containing protein n=1 Tax=Hungatella sp. TaxID=2613924 RepID=UPI003AB60847
MTINILYSSHSGSPVVFAAQELARCLAKIVADSIIITNNQNCRSDEVTLRLESLKNPKNSEDAYSIDVTPMGGTISGSNDRSVLLGVYQYLWLLGCRFPAPGRKHESFPSLYKKEQLSASCQKQAALRHRGVCIEGANSLENILDYIDWLPKLGCNSFFLQFQLPYTFMARWYHHEMNPLLKPEEFTRETAAAFTTRIEEALQERGLLLHQAGHGWTGDVLGFPCADWKAASEPLPPETAPLAACINGKRELFHGVPMNTNLCYSNETVIEKFSDRVAEYCIQHPAISCVHVWLADEFNNICECEACRTQLPTDQYIRILNRIDEKLTGLHLDTKIVFLLYQELLWPPVKEAFRNPDRFLLMFAPISRTFEHSYQLKDTYGPAPAYERNRITLPVGLDENMVFLKSWQNCFHGEGFVYDYPLGRAHYGDFGYIHIAEIIGQDIRKLKQMGLDGYISCQELRVCLPNAFPAYVMGRMLFDADVTFGELKEEYFRAAYGPGWEQVLSYLTKLSSLCSCDYFNGKEDRKDPREAAAMKELIRLAEHAPLPGQEGTDSLTDAQNLFWKYLDYHREYSLRLGKALMKLAGGEELEAQECWRQFQHMICERETEFQECLDVYRVTEVSTKYTGFLLEEPLISTL